MDGFVGDFVGGFCCGFRGEVYAGFIGGLAGCYLKPLKPLKPQALLSRHSKATGDLCWFLI
jgi:hypothetical protein